MSPMFKPVTAKVLEINDVALNTVEVVMAVPKSFSFTAGQYMTLINPSLSELEVREQFRDFSIASGSNELGRLRVVTRKSDSIYKKALFGSGPGAQLEIRNVGGNFILPVDKAVVAIAGGIGITPFLSTLRSGNANFELFYYNRGPEYAVGLPELQVALGKKLRVFYRHPEIKDIEVCIRNDHGPRWFIAGPPKMVASVRTLLKTLMVDDTMIQTEEFSGYGPNS